MTNATDWPGVELDPVERLRVLAAALPDAHLVERTLAAEPAAVWDIAGNLEAAPRFETAIGAVRVLSREGVHVQLEARVGFAWHPMEARLEPGFCVMAGGRVAVGMAACPARDGGTHFAHFEGIRGLGAILRPWYRWALPRELDRIEALAQSTRA